MPDSRFDVDEWRLRGELIPLLDRSIGVKDEDFEVTLEKADRFGGVREWMAVGADVGARLEEVEESLDQGILIPLNREDYSFARAFPGGFFSGGNNGRVQGEDVAGGIGQGIGHVGRVGQMGHAETPKYFR